MSRFLSKLSPIVNYKLFLAFAMSWMVYLICGKIIEFVLLAYYLADAQEHERSFVFILHDRSVYVA